MDEKGIYEDGTPEEIFNNPKRDKTRQFVNHLRCLGEHIVSKNFDFIGMSSRIDAFAHKNLIPKTLFRNIMVVFEELCVQTIVPRQQDKVDVYFTLEYSEKDDNCIALVSYNSDFDINISGDSYSDLLLRNSIESIDSNTNAEKLCSKNYKIVIRKDKPVTGK